MRDREASSRDCWDSSAAIKERRGTVLPTEGMGDNQEVRTTALRPKDWGLR